MKRKLGIILNLFRSFWAGLVKRRSLYQLNFTSGTTTWRECLMVFSSLLKLEPIQNGKWISVFERKVADLLGVRYAFTFSAGRMALYAILNALDIGDGDEVILPGYTCVVVPAAIIYAGAKPVYVDISTEDYNIDVTKIESKITGKTKAIMAQHTYGNPSNVGAIRRICDRYNLVLIEDCAHTIGTFDKGNMLGTTGDVALFSTDHTKFISTSVGGVATTNDELIGQRLKGVYDDTPFLGKRAIMRILLQFIVVNVLYDPRLYFLGKHLFTIYSVFGLTFFMDNYSEIKKPVSYPYPSRMSNIQAKIGVSQVNNLQKNIEHRKTIYLKYKTIFKGFKLKNTSDAPLRFVLEVSNRGEWIESLSPVLAMESWFDSCAQGKKGNLEEIEYKNGECPVAEGITKRVINFPTHLKVRTIDVDNIARRLNQSLLRGIINEVKQND
jgi:dTDP-4-amino-4,6-dideoxygalactose transaminase